MEIRARRAEGGNASTPDGQTAVSITRTAAGARPKNPYDARKVDLLLLTFFIVVLFSIFCVYLFVRGKAPIPSRDLLSKQQRARDLEGRLLGEENVRVIFAHTEEPAWRYAFESRNVSSNTFEVVQMNSVGGLFSFGNKVLGVHEHATGYTSDHLLSGIVDGIVNQITWIRSDFRQGRYAWPAPGQHSFSLLRSEAHEVPFCARASSDVIALTEFPFPSCEEDTAIEEPQKPKSAELMTQVLLSKDFARLSRNDIVSCKHRGTCALHVDLDFFSARNICYDAWNRRGFSDENIRYLKSFFDHLKTEFMSVDCYQKTCKSLSGCADASRAFKTAIKSSLQSGTRRPTSVPSKDLDTIRSVYCKPGFDLSKISAQLISYLDELKLPNERAVPRVEFVNGLFQCFANFTLDIENPSEVLSSQSIRTEVKRLMEILKQRILAPGTIVITRSTFFPAELWSEVEWLLKAAFHSLTALQHYRPGTGAMGMVVNYQVEYLPGTAAAPRPANCIVAPPECFMI